MPQCLKTAISVGFRPFGGFRGKISVLRHLEGFFEKSEENRPPLKLKNSQKFSKLFFLFKDKKLLSKIYLIPWRIFQNLTGPLKALCDSEIRKFRFLEKLLYRVSQNKVYER